MLRDARIAALYAETNERKILRPFSRDPDYVVLLYSLEIRHRAVQLIKEFLASEGYSGRMDRWSVTCAGAFLTQLALSVDCLLDQQINQDIINIITFLNITNKLQIIVNRICQYDRETYIKRIKKQSDQCSKEQLGLILHEPLTIIITIDQFINQSIEIKRLDNFIFDSRTGLISNFNDLCIFIGGRTNQDIPITYEIREVRMLEINKMANSKVSFINHDILDHIITFKVLEEQGFFDQYSAFLTSLGNPYKRYFFNREAELVAAINYARRQFSVLPTSARCQLDLSIIEKILEKSIQSKLPSNSANQNDVLSYLNNLDKASDEAELIAHVLSNTILEAEELQRNYGMTLTFDRKGQLNGRLDPWNPEYLSFVIDGLRILKNSTFQFISVQDIAINLAILMEEEFRGMIISLTKNEFFIQVSDLSDSTSLNFSMSSQTQRLLNEYPHFNTFRDFVFPVP